jgi:hypothetical protein
MHKLLSCLCSVFHCIICAYIVIFYVIYAFQTKRFVLLLFVCIFWYFVGNKIWRPSYNTQVFVTISRSLISFYLHGRVLLKCFSFFSLVNQILVNIMDWARHFSWWISLFLCISCYFVCALCFKSNGLIGCILLFVHMLLFCVFYAFQTKWFVLMHFIICLYIFVFCICFWLRPKLEIKFGGHHII